MTASSLSSPPDGLLLLLTKEAKIVAGFFSKVKVHFVQANKSGLGQYSVKNP